MRRVGIDHELGCPGRRVALGTGRRQGGLHLFHRVQRNARVGTAIQAQHRRLELRRHVQRMPRRQRRAVTHQAPVPRHAGLDLRLVGRIQPGLPAAPAEPGHGQLAGIATVGRRPGHGGVQVAHDLGVGHLGDHLAHQLGEFSVALRVALAHEQLGRDRQVAGARQSHGGVGDVLMHAEDLRQHQHHRQPGFAGRLRPEGRHLESGNVDAHLAHAQAVGGRLDGRLRHDGQRGGGVTHAQAKRQRAAARRRHTPSALIQQRLGVVQVVGLEHLSCLLVVGIGGSLVQCLMPDATDKPTDFWSGQGANRSDTGGIARILNAAQAEKKRFYVADGVEHST